MSQFVGSAAVLAGFPRIDLGARHQATFEFVPTQVRKVCDATSVISADFVAAVSGVSSSNDMRAAEPRLAMDWYDESLKTLHVKARRRRHLPPQHSEESRARSRSQR